MNNMVEYYQSIVYENDLENIKFPIALKVNSLIIETALFWLQSLRIAYLNNH